MSESNSAQITTSNTIKGTNVQVAVRCRPINAEERKSSQPTVISCSPESKSVQIASGPAGKKTTKSFTFDKVFGMYSTQEEVFETFVRPIVDECLAGFNCTVFAYGQTGTGKTHTMEGDINSEEHAGIVPRSVKCILEQLENSEAEYTIRVSFLEIYNEELQDLLVSSKDTNPKKLKLCEEVNKGVVCQNLEEITVLGAQDIFEIMQRGIQNRQTAATLCNKNSSRSHSIFTLKIMIKECNVEGEEVVRHGQLNLVDLAGSECVGRSGAKNDRAREAGNINQSLLTLGRVITALVDHHGHVPYRDSKLTRILQESLGGRAKTCIIATLSPSQSAVEETMSTLDYAYRAKSIKNQPTVNQKMTKKVVLKEYCAEIEQLRAQLMLTREKNGVYVDPETYYQMEAKLSTQENQINECESALKQRQEEIKSLRIEKDDLSAQLLTSKATVAALEEETKKMQEELSNLQEQHNALRCEFDVSEKCIDELQSTQETLYKQGCEYLSEVVLRRSEVNALLQKVDLFKSNEQNRLIESNSFNSQIQTTKVHLVTQIDNILHDNELGSQELCNGVNTMIVKSRETCSVLKESISQVLQTLIVDSAKAKDSMIDSCKSLSSLLSSHDQELVKSLLSLNQVIERCVSILDVSTEQVSLSKAQQEKQLNLLTSNIESTFQSLIVSNKTFCDQQLRATDGTKRLVGEIKSDIVRLAEVYSREINTQSQQIQDKLTIDSKALETQFQSLLHQMVHASITSLKSLSDSAAVASNELINKTNMSMDDVSKEIVLVEDATSQHITSFDQHINEENQKQRAIVSSISDDAVKASQQSIAYHNEVVSFQKEAILVGSGLCDKVHEAVETAQKYVHDTSDVADFVLSAVSTSSSMMNNKTSAAMEEFTAYLDEHANVLASDLKMHLTAIGETISLEVKVGIVEIGDQTVAFDEKIQASKTSSEGATPKKQNFVKLLDLESPREADEIKDEIRKYLSSHAAAVETCLEKVELSVESAVEQTIETAAVTRSSISSSKSVSSHGSTSSTSSNGSKKRKNLDINESNSTSAPAAALENNHPNLNASGTGSSKIVRLNSSRSRSALG